MKISVIVPIYNQEKYIEECIQSILNQTYENFELLLIDDGSTDQSFEIMQSYEKDARIKIFQKENGGQASARNLGIKKAEGEYITFVDSDDYIEKYMLEDFIHMAKQENADIVIGNIQKVKEDKIYPMMNYEKKCEDPIKNYMTSHMGPTARLYKTALFIENDLYFKENIIYEDLATIPLLGIYAKKVCYKDQIYYNYRIVEGSTMKQMTYHPKLENIFISLQSLEEEFHKRSGKTFEKELEYLYIEHLLYSASMRFLTFDKKIMIDQIVHIMKEKYPNYQKNLYYQKKSFKFKLVCFLVIHKQYRLLKMLMKGKSNI